MKRVLEMMVLGALLANAAGIWVYYSDRNYLMTGVSMLVVSIYAVGLLIAKTLEEKKP